MRWRARFLTLQSSVALSIGRIAGLWRYPVNSIAGAECDRLTLEPRGVVGDRRWAVRDHEGKLGSGKHTRRFRRMDGLLALQPEESNGALAIRFPNGRSIVCGEALDAALTEYAGIPVTLAEERDVPHHDAGPIHVLTTASLRWLQSILPGAAIDVRRFRPNLVIEADGTEPRELNWVGRRLRLGDAVVLKIVAPTERCAMVTLAQRDLREDASILRAITQRANLEFGVYAEVQARGEVKAGDRAVLD